MKKRIVNFLAVMAILIGCSVLLYPTVSNYLTEANGSYAIENYNDAVEKMEQEKKEALLERARRYNETLSGTEAVGDPFSAQTENQEDEYWDILNVEKSGLIGYIRIPKIHIELPIYHGTGENVLQKGVGHWKGSSLPVGGDSTHAVLTGHRGLPTSDLFSDLDQMAAGDVFYLKILGDTLAYQVDDIQTVLPQETQSLQIAEGQDYVTLVTCTPYAVNTHRLLVRGHRIPYEEAVEIVPDKVEKKIWIPIEVKAVIGVLAVFVIMLSIYGIIRIRRKKTK